MDKETYQILLKIQEGQTKTNGELERLGDRIENYAEKTNERFKRIEVNQEHALESRAKIHDKIEIFKKEVDDKIDGVKKNWDQKVEKVEGEIEDLKNAPAKEALEREEQRKATVRKSVISEIVRYVAMGAIVIISYAVANGGLK